MTEPEAWAAHLPEHEETEPMDKIDTSTDAVRALLDGVTPGPWVGVEDDSVKHPGGSVFETGCGCCTSPVLSDANARFIAASRALVPALLAERDDLRAKVDRMRVANGILEDALQEAGDDYPGSSMQEWCQQQVKAARAALKGAAK